MTCSKFLSPLNKRLFAYSLFSFLSFPSGAHAAELAYIDIHYGDEFVGAVLAEFDDVHIRFQNVAELMSLLPDVVDEDYAREYFSAVIEYQQASSCTSEIYQQCFTEDGPGIIVTFDSALFIANIYLAKKLLTLFEVDVEKYLPTFKSAPSYLASFGGIYSTASSDLLPRSESYNASLTQVLSSGNKRFTSEVGYANAHDFYVREANFVGESQGTRVIGGRYELFGDLLFPSRLIQGFGIHSTIDLRLDLDQNGGSRIELFLPQRSRVELYRDGRLLSADYYEIGYQQLDISKLPDGAYDLEIRVITNGIVTEQQTQFFTKSTRLPPVGESQTSFDVGQVAKPLKLGSEADSTFIRFDHAVRLNDPGYVQFSALGTRRWTAVQAGYSWIMRESIGRMDVQLADDGYRALAFALSRHLQSGLISLDWARASVPSVEPGRIDHLRRFSENADTSSLRYIVGTSRWAFQGALKFVVSDFANERVTSMSAHIFPIVDNDQFKVSGSTQHSSRAGFQLSIDFLWNMPTRSHNVFARTRWINQNGQRVLSAVGMAGSRVDGLRNTAIRYNTVFEEFEQSKNAGAGVYYRNELFSTDSNINIESGGFHNRSLSTSLYSAFAVSDRKLKLFSDIGAGAGVVVSLPDKDDSSVTVVINENRRVSIAAGTTQFIPLEAYERYSLRVQPASGGNLEYDLKNRHVVLYPGHVPVLEWRGNKVIAVFGQLTIAAIEQGEQVEVTTSRGRDSAENGGYFVADVASADASISFVRDGEVLCQMSVDVEAASDGLLDLGLVNCE